MAAKRSASAVWDYFTINSEVAEIAICNMCNANIRRGRAGVKEKFFSTNSLWGHLKAKHKDEFSQAEEKQADDIQIRAKKRKEQEERAQVYVVSGATFASTSKQLTLEETLNIGKKWDSKHPEQIEGEKLLTYWLCDSLKAYDTVENEQFHKFVNHLCKRFKVPSEKVIRTKHIPELNAKVQFVLKQVMDLNSAEKSSFSVTTDIWTSPSRDSFMSVTAHWITADFKRKIVILRCIRYNTDHTAVKLAESLKGIFNDWGLDNVHVIVRDNASNIVLGTKTAGFQSIGCFCHILHLIVHHSVLEQSGVKLMIGRVRTLVKKLRQPKMKTLFSKYQEQACVPINSMLLDCETRWSSVHTMLERVQQQKQAIKLAEDDPQLAFAAEAKLTPNDWDLIPKALALLGPISAATKAAESDTASVSDMIPLTKKIKLEISQVTQPGIGTMKEKLLVQISRYFEGGDSRAHFISLEKNPITVIATLLDPRYKAAVFQNKNDCQRAKETLLSEIMAELRNQMSASEQDEDTMDIESKKAVTGRPPSSEQAESSLSWAAIFDEESENSSGSTGGICPNITETATTELNKYMKMKRINISDDPLAFWKGVSTELPTLSKLARKHLAAPPSSTASEREFKVGKNIQTKNRIKLSHKNLETLLFLKYNLRALSYQTVLPTVPDDFILPNERQYDVDASDDSSDED